MSACMLQHHAPRCPRSQLNTAPSHGTPAVKSSKDRLRCEHHGVARDVCGEELKGLHRWGSLCSVSDSGGPPGRHSQGPASDGHAVPVPRPTALPALHRCVHRPRLAHRVRALCTASATSPLSPAPPPPPLRGLRAVRTNGVPGLYRGFTSMLFGQQLVNIVKFSAYQHFRRVLDPAYTYMGNAASGASSATHRAWHVPAAACASGVVNSFILCPVELVKVRLQTTFKGQRFSVMEKLI